MAPQADRFSRFLIGFALFVALCAQAGAQQPKVPPSFEPLLASLWPDAQARGVSRKTFDLAFAGLTPDPRVAALTMRQLEYGVPVATYLARIASPPRIEGAARKAREWKPTLDAIEKQYGVDRWIILALWGIETSFGANSGGFDVIRSLATLMAIDYRADYFRGELIAALQVLQQRHVAREKMIGSWAGAMGQPQFMPSSYLRYAEDFDGDGRRNIWDSPSDIFASVANYLKGRGWVSDRRWGREVKVSSEAAGHIASDVPQRAGSCRATRDMTVALPLKEWQRLGVRLKDGRTLPSADQSASLVSGSSRHFLVYGNYDALLEYNCAHAYALSVALLADAFAS